MQSIRSPRACTASTPGSSASPSGAAGSSRSAITSPMRICRLSSSAEPSREDAPALDEGDAVAELLGLAHVVGGQDDGGVPLPPQLRDLGADADGHVRIEAERRLVEEEHLRIVQERLGEGQALLEPGGELVVLGLEVRGQLEPLEQLVHAVPERRARGGRRGARRRRAPRPAAGSTRTRRCRSPCSGGGGSRRPRGRRRGPGSWRSRCPAGAAWPGWRAAWSCPLRWGRADRRWRRAAPGGWRRAGRPSPGGGAIRCGRSWRDRALRLRGARPAWPAHRTTGSARRFRSGPALPRRDRSDRTWP